MRVAVLVLLLAAAVAHASFMAGSGRMVEVVPQAQEEFDEVLAALQAEMGSEVELEVAEMRAPHLKANKAETGSLGQLLKPLWFNGTAGISCVDRSLKFAGPGRIESWTVEVNQPGYLLLQVWRPTATSGVFALVGENRVKVLQSRKEINVQMEESDQLHFDVGDMLGWHYENAKVAPGWTTRGAGDVVCTAEGVQHDVGEQYLANEERPGTFSVRANFAYFGDCKPHTDAPEGVHLIGHRLSPSRGRDFVVGDTPRTAMVDMSLRMDWTGRIEAWRVLALNAGPVGFGVWRPTDGNKTHFVLVKENTVRLQQGMNEVAIPRNEQVSFQPGDYVGWRFGAGGNMLAYENGPTEVRAAPAPASASGALGALPLDFAQPGANRTYFVQAKFMRHGAVPAPLPLPVNTGAHPNTTFAVGDGLGDVEASEEPVSFTVHAMDADSVPLHQGGDAINVLVRGPGEVEESVVDKDDGSYQISWAPTVAGEYTVRVTVRGVDIRMSPFTVHVHASDVYAPACTLEGMPSNATAAGHAVRFAVQSRDRFGNAVARGGEHYDVRVSGPGPVLAEVHDRDDGSYGVSFEPTVAGPYTVRALLGGIPLAAEHKLTVVAGPTAAERCKVSGAAVRLGAVGVLNTFTLTAFDAYGNARLVGGDTFTAYIDGPLRVDASEIEDHGDGTYEVTYVTTDVGEYALHVSHNDLPVFGAPFALTVQPGKMDPDHSTATGDALRSGTAGVESQFDIATHDRYGNKVYLNEIKPAVRVTDAAGAVLNATVVVTGNGTYAAMFTPRTAGTYEVAVRVEGKDIGGSPFHPIIVPSQVSAALSSADGVGLAQASAGTPATFALVARDEQGNRLDVGGHNFHISFLGRSPVNVTSTDNDDGTESVRYETNVAGEYEIDVTLDGTPIANSPFTTIVDAGDASAVKSVLMGNADALEVNAESELTIVAKDIFGNVKKEGGDKFAFTATGEGPVESTVTDNGDGTYRVVVRITEEGDYAFAATLGGSNVLNSPMFVSVMEPNAAEDAKDAETAEMDGGDADADAETAEEDDAAEEDPEVAAAEAEEGGAEPEDDGVEAEEAP